VTKVVLSAEPISDGQTALRPWRDSDLDALVEACQDPEISRWTRVPTPYGQTDALTYLMQRYDAIHGGRSAPFAIVEPDGPGGESGALLGSISLMHLAWEHARAEVGYWLAADARGRGHATRAVRLICDWGFRELALERIVLFAAVGNSASQRVAERAGFTREAVLRSYLSGVDGRDDAIAFGLMAGEQAATSDASRRQP
jgi:RimJ/RimL family protein N-acetyltransferase